MTEKEYYQDWWYILSESDSWPWLPQSCSFGLIFPSTASICYRVAFPPMGSSDHVVILVSIDFSANSKGDAPFNRTAYGYSHADWDNFCDHLRDMGGYP